MCLGEKLPLSFSFVNEMRYFVCMKTNFLFLILTCAVFLHSSLVRAQINPASNFIGLDISTPAQNASFTYDSCFALGANLGMSRVGMYQNWTAIETAPLTYNLAIMDIANAYYPAYHMAVDLTIAPIHTNNLEVPADLKGLVFDSPVMIARFNTLLDSIKAHLPKLILSSLVVGSEHDVYLGTNPALWTQYTNFYKAVSAHARTLWPSLKVATELTFNGITTQNTRVQSLNETSDYIGVSYYPLNPDFTVKPISSVPTDFAQLISLYPAKPICFYQYGFPSSATCNSSEALQAEFIAQTFRTWDTHASHVRMIDFTWLHDLDTALVHYYRDYYGLSDPIFLEYLRSLGLRTWNGTNKKAFLQLQCEAKQRGYNKLNAECGTVLALEQSSVHSLVSLFPNPVQSELNIELPYDVQNAELKIVDAWGQTSKSFSRIKGRSLRIETRDLGNGVYVVELSGQNLQLKQPFMVVK